jgi:hypothetical protein
MFVGFINDFQRVNVEGLFKKLFDLIGCGHNMTVMPAKAGTQCLLRLSRFLKDAGSLLPQG